MFNAQALKKVSQLLQVFSKRDRRYRIRLRSWEDFKGIPVSGREDIKTFTQAGALRDIFNMTATSG